jgi:hypothetical protein
MLPPQRGQRIPHARLDEHKILFNGIQLKLSRKKNNTPMFDWRA